MCQSLWCLYFSSVWLPFLTRAFLNCILRGFSFSLKNVLWLVETTEYTFKARFLEDLLLSVRNIMKEPSVIQMSTWWAHVWRESRAQWQIIVVQEERQNKSMADLRGELASTWQEILVELGCPSHMLGWVGEMGELNDKLYLEKVGWFGWELSEVFCNPKLCCFEFQTGLGSFKGIVALWTIEMVKTRSLMFLPVQNSNMFTN